jgi:hypothetical protein
MSEMLEIVRGLNSIQAQVEALRRQILSSMPDSGSPLASMCSVIATEPFALKADVCVQPYREILPRFWLGFAPAEGVVIRQQLKLGATDDLEFSIAVPDAFESKWLTLEFQLARGDIVTKSQLSLETELTGSANGTVMLALKAFAKENAHDPVFKNLAQYPKDTERLMVSDIVPLTEAMSNMTEMYEEIRVLLFLPPEAGARFTFHSLRLSLF